VKTSSSEGFLTICCEKPSYLFVSSLLLTFRSRLVPLFFASSSAHSGKGSASSGAEGNGSKGEMERWNRIGDEELKTETETCSGKFMVASIPLRVTIMYYGMQPCMNLSLDDTKSQ
jgi:hypothetical protein